MAKSTYKVVGDSKMTVDGKDYGKGDEFTTDSFTEEQAAALVEAGHIKQVEKKG